MQSTMLMVLMWICVIIVLLLDQKGHTVFANNYIDLTQDDEEIQDYIDLTQDDIMDDNYNADGYYINLNNEEECVNKKCTKMADRFAPYCETCSPVEVRTSLIPGAGSGLFTKRKIMPDEAIADYKSGTQEMTRTQLDQAYPDALPTHVWSSDQVTFYDGSNTNNSIAGLANTGKAWRNNKAQPNNARLCKSGMLRAPLKKSIAKGKEVLIAYNW